MFLYIFCFVILFITSLYCSYRAFAIHGFVGTYTSSTVYIVVYYLLRYLSL